MTFGERAADTATRLMGTWTFIIGQTLFMVTWVIGNIWFLRGWGTPEFDPFPFILLNLCLSVQAALTGPLLLLAGNRQAERDRVVAHTDLALDQAALDALKEVQKDLRLIHKLVKATKTP